MFLNNKQFLLFFCHSSSKWWGCWTHTFCEPCPLYSTPLKCHSRFFSVDQGSTFSIHIRIPAQSWQTKNLNFVRATVSALSVRSNAASILVFRCFSGLPLPEARRDKSLWTGAFCLCFIKRLSCGRKCKWNAVLSCITSSKSFCASSEVFTCKRVSVKTDFRCWSKCGR